MDDFYQQLSQLKQINKKLRQDMSERDLLEEKLRSSENKVRAIFEAMTDIVLIIHADKNELSNVEIIPTKYINSHNSDIDLIGETVEYFFQERLQSTWLEQVNQALKLVQTIHYDYSLLVENHEYWFSASISPICETQVVWVARDISERKRAEEALQESELRERKKSQELETTLAQLKLTQARLLLSDKMASLGSLVAGIAHEINNPVNVIVANLTYAQEYFEDLLKLIQIYQNNSS